MTRPRADGRAAASSRMRIELHGVAGARPVGMVDVLPAPGIVDADGEDVRVRPVGDPHVGPRRRDDESLGACALLGLEWAVRRHPGT